MTDSEARRLCLLEMADTLARSASGDALWVRADEEGKRRGIRDRRTLTQAAEALVQQWRDEAAALREEGDR